ncbi:hypothetical protein THAOC_01907, partial [Thalassiosira oceanica]
NVTSLPDCVRIGVDDPSYDVPANVAGDFGVGDFYIEMDISGTDLPINYSFCAGGCPSFNYGALFIRSGRENHPYEGPSAFIATNGDVLFRVHAEEELIIEKVLPDIANSAVTYHLEFLRRGSKLVAEIDGKKYEKTITKEIGAVAAELLKRAPLRFRGNHVTSDYQPLILNVTNISIN